MIALLLAASALAQAPAGPNPPSHVERRFDTKGQLTEMTFFDYSVQPPLIERLMIVRNQPSIFELRTRTTERGKVLLRRETEKYSKPGVLTEREMVWGDQNNGQLDRKTIMIYSNRHVEAREYELVGKDWKLKRTTQHENGMDN